jgi:ankyrin repeat protein
MNYRPTQWGRAFFAIASLFAGCQRDNGREIVNAAGISQAEVLTLINQGADVNASSRSRFGWTPLISAIYSQKEDVVGLLIAHGADVNKGDSKNETPLLWAITVWNENTNVIRKLVEFGADPRIKSTLGTDAFLAAESQPNAAQILNILNERRPQLDSPKKFDTR